MNQINWNELLEYRDGKLYWKNSTFSGRDYNRAAAVAGEEAGSMRNGGYWHFSYQGKFYTRHSVVWIMHNGDIPKGYVVDHIKSVKETEGVADDRIENLQVITFGANIRKGGGSTPNVSNQTSTRRGVSLDRKYKAKPWRARMKVEDVVLCEHFTSFEDACAQREAWENLHCK